jgi:hypothetical protein
MSISSDSISQHFFFLSFFLSFQKKFKNSKIQKISFFKKNTAKLYVTVIPDCPFCSHRKTAIPIDTIKTPTAKTSANRHMFAAHLQSNQDGGMGRALGWGRHERIEYAQSTNFLHLTTSRTEQWAAPRSNRPANRKNGRARKACQATPFARLAGCSFP